MNSISEKAGEGPIPLSRLWPSVREFDTGPFYTILAQSPLTNKLFLIILYVFGSVPGGQQYISRGDYLSSFFFSGSASSSEIIKISTNRKGREIKDSLICCKCCIMARIGCRSGGAYQLESQRDESRLSHTRSLYWRIDGGSKLLKSPSHSVRPPPTFSIRR